MKCAALRGPRKRAPCGKPASPTPFLVANEAGFWKTHLCLWCAIEQPRTWALGVIEPLTDPVNVLATYPSGPWEQPTAAQAAPVLTSQVAQELDLSELMSMEFGL